jgi:hypothetical protein
MVDLTGITKNGMILGGLLAAEVAELRLTFDLVTCPWTEQA